MKIEAWDIHILREFRRLQSVKPPDGAFLQVGRDLPAFPGFEQLLQTLVTEVL